VKLFMKDNRLGLYVGLLAAPVILFTLVYITSLYPNTLTEFDLMKVAFAASLIGCSITFLKVGEPFRTGFTVEKEHENGYGNYTAAKCNLGIYGAVCELVSCPVCTGAWAAEVLLLTVALFPNYGHTIINWGFAASVAWMITNTLEYLKSGSDKNREQAGYYHQLTGYEKRMEKKK